MARERSPNRRVPAHEHLPFSPGPHIDPERLARWLDAASIRPISAVRWDWARNHRLPARVLPNDLWLFVEHGRGCGVIGEAGENVRFHRGEMLSIPARTLHELTAETDTRFVSIHFRALVYGAVSMLDLVGFPLVLPRSTKAPWETMSLRLAREQLLEPPGWLAVMESGLRWMLLHAIRECGDVFRARRAMDHEGLPRMLPALDRIAEGADDPDLSVGELARRVHLSEQQFRKIFRRVTGSRPVEFVQARRIELAARLLRSTDLGVEAIAFRAGFSDATYFHRVFRKLMKSTPREYRLRHEP